MPQGAVAGGAVFQERRKPEIWTTCGLEFHNVHSFGEVSPVLWSNWIGGYYVHSAFLKFQLCMFFTSWAELFCVHCLIPAVNCSGEGCVSVVDEMFPVYV